MGTVVVHGAWASSHCDSTDRTRKRYGADLKEHPLLDDNGDGVGHFGPVPEGGDGAVAAKRFLGDAGKPLRVPPQAVQALAELNSGLRLE